MRRLSILTLPVFCCALFLGACKKTANTNIPISSDDAVEMTASSLASNSNGIASITLDATANAQAMFNLKLGCGGTKTYNYSKQSAPGATTTYSYSHNFNYTLNCNANNAADNITGIATASGNFESPRMKATSTGTGSFKIGGLTTSATTYVVNAEYKFTGNFIAKTGNRKTNAGVVTITVANLTINKNTQAIISGTGTANVKGTSGDNAVALNGTLTFTDGGKARLTVNGVIYVIDLLTGVVSK